MSIKLKGSTDGSVSLQAPADTSPTGTDKTLILPTGVGSAGQVLKNGSTAGTLEFGAVPATAMPTGSILQVKQTHLNTADSQSLSANTKAEISNLSVSITPTTTTSDMLVFVRWNGEPSANNHNITFGLRRDSTDIGQPAAAGSRAVNLQGIAQGFWAQDDASTPDSASYFYLDKDRSASSSAITYKATVRCSTAITLYNQRNVNDADGGSTERLTSTIIVMEVAA